MKRSCIRTHLFAALNAAAVLTAGVAAPVAEAQSVYRLDPHRAQWHTFEGRSGCHIAHEIPGKGVALISYRHDGQQYLSFFFDRPPRSEIHGDLFIASPPWAGEHRRHVEPVRLHPDRRTLRLSRQTTQQLLGALRDGREPLIRYEQGYNDDLVEIALTPAAFQRAHHHYNECIDRHRRVDAGTATRGALIPGRTGDALADSEGPTWEGNLPRLPRGPRTEVYFATNSSDLTRDSIIEIRRFVRELEDNPHWGVVLTIGYADLRGSPETNKALARLRAEQVRNELTRLGVPAQQIKVEARLIESDPTEDGPAVDAAESVAGDTTTDSAEDESADTAAPELERDLLELANNRRVELRTAL